MAQTRKVSKNNTTVIHDDDGGMTVTLHKTPVVQVKGDIITLNNGGWVTLTTATRMNQAANEYRLGYTVGRKQGQMSVSVHLYDKITGARIYHAKQYDFDKAISFNRKTGERVDL